jgi:hypothetical protein
MGCELPGVVRDDAPTPRSEASPESSASSQESIRDATELSGAVLHGVVNPHRCQHCAHERFTIHIYDAIELGKFKWKVPNESLSRFAAKYYAAGLAATKWQELNGVSIFDVGVQELTSFWQDGCQFAGFLLSALFSIYKSDVPKGRFTFGGGVERNEVNFLVYDIHRATPIYVEHSSGHAYWLMLAAPGKRSPIFSHTITLSDP